MRKAMVLAVMLGAMSLLGCKKQVPTDIVQKSLRNALRLHAPQTTSGMCGVQVKGLINANITNVVRKPDGATGTAHVSGAPWSAPGAPALCEGDVEFKYSSKSRTTGSTKRRTTTTTWFLEHVKLVAVQTRGVAFKAVDEDADDEDKLDSRIAACRMHGAPVYVVGAPAPFGRRNIEFKYVDPDPNFDQSVQWLPVRSGPESFLPEMVNMGFIGFERRDADLYRMDSGFGPYCLTRLCYETGGIFFSVHAARPESAEGFVPSASTPAMSARLNYFFDPSIMRSYMPDYLPVNEYVKKISANKAKQQLVRTAEMSMVMPMDRPQLVFDRNPDNEAALKRTLDEAQKKAAILEPELNMLYSTLKQGEADRPKITEPRWQANFDLAMARILAAKVRTEGYNFMLARAKGGLKYDNPKTNLLELQASDDVTWSSQHKKMADQARELLQRVAHDHSGTPWAKLAEEELQHPIGWRWVARYIPPPPAPAVAKANPKATPTPPPPNNARPKAPPRPMNAQPKPVRQNIKL